MVRNSIGANDTYKAEIRHAEEMMETWKGHVLQHTVAEQIKITYERVVKDLESHLKFRGIDKRKVF